MIVYTYWLKYAFNNCNEPFRLYQYKEKVVKFLEKNNWYKVVLQNMSLKQMPYHIRTKWFKHLGPDNIKGHRWRIGFFDYDTKTVDMFFENKYDAVIFKISHSTGEKN